MSLSLLLAQAHPVLSARLQASPPSAPPRPCVLFFSLCDGKTRAHIVRGAGADFAAAWQHGAAQAQREARRHQLAVRWLRVDWVVDVQASTWGALRRRLAETKRNYFRLGLALDPELKWAFLEPELNANAMLYSGADQAEAGLNEKNFTAYAQRRFGPRAVPDFAPDTPVYVFAHDGLFLGEGHPPVRVPGAGRADVHWQDPAALNAGRRQIRRLRPEQVYALIDSGANFLARQVKADGKFVYGHFPCFGRTIPTYNTLRHASSVYAMLEAWELTRNDALLAAIRRAIDYLTGTIIRRYPRADGTTLAFNVDMGDEIKLGANAVSLLALVKYDELTGDTRHRGLMEALALGISHMQDRQTGGFVHVLHAADLSVKTPFRIVYYDGEAAFGLMRLYGLTRDERWLQMVERAFAHFLRVDHWKHHDHWLSYCANELTLYRPEEKYFRFGVRNVAGLLDFILERETTYPTLLELCMAFQAMLERIERDHPDMRHVLAELDIDKFHRALHHRAHYLLNGFFWPELAMYYAKPQTVVGSFFIRHHAFRVRIDDIEHYLSGYVAYWKLLRRGGTGGARLAQATQEGGPGAHTAATTPAPAGPPEVAPPAKASAAQPPMPAPASTTDAPHGPTVAWGGDVNLGRRQHYRTAELGVEQVLRVPALAQADLAIVNLECVVATQGEQGADKGEGGPYYYRARPEMLRVLTTAGVDLVATANNHSGDYGPEALREQARWLDAVGIGHAGSGADRDTAWAPVIRRAGDLNVALFSVDASMPSFAATETRTGSAHLPRTDLRAWRETLAPRIAAAREQAHVVLVAVHWDVTVGHAPNAQGRALAHALIDMGADAVLGASAHQLQGIEIYRGRPIVHNAGDLLFDAVRATPGDTGVFRLTLSPHGVTRVCFVPVALGFGASEQLAGAQARAASERFATLCAGLGTTLTLAQDGSAFVDLDPPPRPSPSPDPAPLTRYHPQVLDAPVSDDDPRWRVPEVPADARIEPVRLGPLTLLGVRAKPETITRREMLWVESFWRCDAPLDENMRLHFRAVPVRASRMPAWGEGMDHDPCDWMVPTSRWRPGVIYRDHYGLRPPPMSRLENVAVRLSVGIVPHRPGVKPVLLSITVPLQLPGQAPAPAAEAATADADEPATCYICVHQVGERLAGIERAALARTRLFADHLGVVPHVLSNHLDPHIMERWAHYQALGWVDPRAVLSNLYEELLDISAGSALPPAHVPMVPGLRPETVPAQPLHQRIRRTDGTLRAYVAWRDRPGGRLDYVNHFAGGAKWRRDLFNRHGQRQVSQALDAKTGRVLWEDGYTPDGRRLVRRYDAASGALAQIEVLDAEGGLEAVFDREEDLTVWWLRRKITRPGQVFIIDRGPQWTRALQALRGERPQHLVSVMHNTHLRPGEDPLTGTLDSRDRREVLSRRDSVDACVILTEHQRRNIAARFRNGCPLVVIPHPVEGRITEAAFDARDPDLLVAFVRLAEDKRVDHMVEIMARVVRALPEKRLHIYGDGPRREALQDLIRTRGLQEHVFLDGYTTRVGEVLDRASFSLLTSRREGFALAVLESLAHGCPVLAYDIRYGPAAMIEHGRNGLLLPEGDVEGAAAALTEALRDRERLRAMSAQAYVKARAFKAAHIAQRWGALLGRMQPRILAAAA